MKRKSKSKSGRKTTLQHHTSTTSSTPMRRIEQPKLDQEEMQEYINAPDDTTFNVFFREEKKSGTRQHHKSRLLIQETHELYEEVKKQRARDSPSPYWTSLQTSFQNYFKENQSRIHSDDLVQIPIAIAEQPLQNEWDYLCSQGMNETHSGCFCFQNTENQLILFAIPDIMTSRQQLSSESAFSMFRPFDFTFMKKEWSSLNTNLSDAQPPNQNTINQLLLKCVPYRHINFSVFVFTYDDKDATLKPVYSWRDIDVAKAGVLKTFDEKFRQKLMEHYTSNLDTIQPLLTNAKAYLSNYFCAYVEDPKPYDQFLSLDYEYVNCYSKTINDSWYFLNVMLLRQVINRIEISNGKYCQITRNVFVNTSVFTNNYLPFVQTQKGYVLANSLCEYNINCERVFNVLDTYKFMLLKEQALTDAASAPASAPAPQVGPDDSEIDSTLRDICERVFRNKPPDNCTNIIQYFVYAMMMSSDETLQRKHEDAVYAYLRVLHEYYTPIRKDLSTAEQSAELFRGKTVEDLITANEKDIRCAENVDFSYEKKLDIYYWSYVHKHVREYIDTVGDSTKAQTNSSRRHSSRRRSSCRHSSRHYSIRSQSNTERSQESGGGVKRWSAVRRASTSQRRCRRCTHPRTKHKTEKKKKGGRPIRYKQGTSESSCGTDMYRVDKIVKTQPANPQPNPGLTISQMKEKKFTIKRMYDSYLHAKSLVVTEATAPTAEPEEKILHVNLHTPDKFKKLYDDTKPTYLYSDGNGSKYGFIQKTLKGDQKTTFLNSTTNAFHEMDINLTTYCKFMDSKSIRPYVAEKKGETNGKTDVRYTYNLNREKKTSPRKFITKLFNGTQDIWTCVFEIPSLNGEAIEKYHSILRKMFPISDDRSICIVPSEDISLSNRELVNELYSTLSTSTNGVDLRHKHIVCQGWYLPKELRKFYSRSPYGNIIPVRCMRKYVGDSANDNDSWFAAAKPASEDFNVDTSSNVLIALDCKHKDRHNITQAYATISRVFEFRDIYPNSCLMHIVSGTNIPHYRMEAIDVKRVNGYRDSSNYSNSEHMHGHLSTYNPKERIGFSLSLVELLSKVDTETYDDKTEFCDYTFFS